MEAGFNGSAARTQGFQAERRWHSIFFRTKEHQRAPNNTKSRKETMDGTNESDVSGRELVFAGGSS